MKINEVKCDFCGRDKSYTTNCEEYLLQLTVRNVPKQPGLQSVTLMGVYPPLDRNYDFCNMHCLEQWLNKRDWVRPI